MHPEDLLKNNARWFEDTLQADNQYKERLSSPQHPEVLYIGCSDSRVSPERMMDVGPGEVFVHRNVGNIVVPTDENVHAVVFYGVKALKVKHIVVCGHIDCGAVKAVLQDDVPGRLDSWLRAITKVYDRHKSELLAIEEELDRLAYLVELNVLQQCRNVQSIPVVQESVANKEVQIHGWVFDLSSGRIRDLNYA